MADLGSRLRLRARHTRLSLLDLVDSALGRRSAWLPPRREIERIGGFDFVAVGEHLASIARELGGLQPGERILDVGCGIGRLAVPLKDYLVEGEYAGFDISRRAIRWCRANIEEQRPNFHFTFADVRNRHYNRRGRVDALEFVFPYATASVDLAFASSVFTHLLPDAADRYLAEVARVLKPGGRFVGSFFLLTRQVRLRAAELSPSFRSSNTFFTVQDPQDPEAAIAFDEVAVREALERHGMPLEELRRGSWAHGGECLSFQDFVLARKRTGGS